MPWIPKWLGDLVRLPGASALLANCGFFCPCKPKGLLPHYDQVVWVSAEGDRPAEGISAFGYEAMISAALLRRAGEGTLALVDEFGRGTEPRAAKAAVCTLLEELSARQTQFVVATHLHDVVDAKLRARAVAWRMGLRRSGDSKFASWTYQLELGVCRDSLAGQTLLHFGWPKLALERFHALLEADEDEERQETAGDDDVTSATNGKGAEDLDLSKETIRQPTSGPEALASDPEAMVIEMMSSLGETSSIVRLNPRDMPPAPLCAGASILYTLILRNQILYIGQSDNLQKRLQQHQQRFGERLEAVLLLPVENTSRARQLETKLQRQLLRRGITLDSSGDALHRNFSIKEDTQVSDGTASQLRQMAQQLLQMAEQLEEGSL